MAGAPPGAGLPDSVGEYRILRSLGTGAMAEVLLGSVAGPGGFERKFAIKRVRRRLLDDRQLVAMLLDEARIAGRLVAALERMRSLAAAAPGGRVRAAGRTER